MRTGIRGRMGLATVAVSMLLVSVAAAQVVYKQFNEFQLPGVNQAGNLSYDNGIGELNAPMKSFKYLRINLTVGVQAAYVTNLSGSAQNYKNPQNFAIADPVSNSYLTPTTSNYVVARTPGDHKAFASYVGSYVGSRPR